MCHVSGRLILLLGRAGSSGGYDRLAGEESELNNVNCTAAQESPGAGGPDCSDTDSNCTDLELEEETSDDSDYGEYRKHWPLARLPASSFASQ
jgi:hypothetical protein